MVGTRGLPPQQQGRPGNNLRREQYRQWNRGSSCNPDRREIRFLVLATAQADIESSARSGESLAQLQLAELLDGSGHHDAAREWLERAAASGDVLGQTLLGEVLVSRIPYDVGRGVLLVRRAAQAGNARAAHLLALLA